MIICVYTIKFEWQRIKFVFLINETEDLKEDREQKRSISIWLLTFLIPNVCIYYWQVQPIILIDMFIWN